MSGLRTRKGPRTLLGLLAALGMVAALTMPALAGAEVEWATVTGYADGSEDNNHPETWGDNCTDAGIKDVATWELPELPEGEVYTLVVVKAGSDASTEFANTKFENPSAGQTVWADSNGDGEFGEGDKQISHIIVCTGEEAPPSEAPPSEAPPSEVAESELPAESEVPAQSEREDTLGGNPTPAAEVPDTAMGGFGQLPATVLSLVLIGALAGMVYVRVARQR